MTEDDIPQEEVTQGKRGRGRGTQNWMVDNVITTYHPMMHLHVCTRSKCPRGGYGFKLCGPQFTGDLSPQQQTQIDYRFQMEEGRGQQSFDQIQGELEKVIRETDEKRFEYHLGNAVERFCATPPLEILKGIVREMICDECRKEEKKS